MTQYIDLTNTPPIEAMALPSWQAEYDLLLDLLKTSMGEDAPEVIQPNEPFACVLRAVALRNIQLIQRQNEQVRAVMLAFSQGPNLDGLAGNLNVARLLIDPGDPDTSPPRPAAWETDAALKRRLLLKLESISVAGTEAAYRFHALRAHPQVKDVGLHTPGDCRVVLAVLSHNGSGIPTEAEVAAVRQALTDDVRPVGDDLSVIPATVKPYQIQLTAHVLPGVDASVIQSDMEATLAAWVNGQHRLGATVSLDAIASYARAYAEDRGTGQQTYCLTTNVTRIEIQQPETDIHTDATTAPHCTGISLHIEVSP